MNRNPAEAERQASGFQRLAGYRLGTQRQIHSEYRDDRVRRDKVVRSRDKAGAVNNAADMYKGDFLPPFFRGE